MALVRVCTNCGWRKRVRSRYDDDNRYCPRCTSVTHVTDQSGEWSFYIVLITGAIVFALLILGCPLICVGLWVLQ